MDLVPPPPPPPPPQKKKKKKTCEQIYLSKRILSGEKLMLSPVNNTVGTVTC